MYRSTAKAVTAVHDVFVFVSLAFTVCSFFLRNSRSYSEMPAIRLAILLLWLAFCVWSAWKTLSALIRGGGVRTAKFEALMERRAQEGGSAAGGLWAMTVITGLLRLAVPALLWAVL